MKVPEADRRTRGEAGEARAAGGFVYGIADDLGSEERDDLSERRGASGILGRVGPLSGFRSRKGSALR